MNGSGEAGSYDCTLLLDQSMNALQESGASPVPMPHGLPPPGPVQAMVPRPPRGPLASAAIVVSHDEPWPSERMTRSALEKRFKGNDFLIELMTCCKSASHQRQAFGLEAAWRASLGACDRLGPHPRFGAGLDVNLAGMPAALILSTKGHVWYEFARLVPPGTHVRTLRLPDGIALDMFGPADRRPVLVVSRLQALLAAGLQFINDVPIFKEDAPRGGRFLQQHRSWTTSDNGHGMRTTQPGAASAASQPGDSRTVKKRKTQPRDPAARMLDTKMPPPGVTLLNLLIGSFERHPAAPADAALVPYTCVVPDLDLEETLMLLRADDGFLGKLGCAGHHLVNFVLPDHHVRTLLLHELTSLGPVDQAAARAFIERIYQVPQIRPEDLSSERYCVLYIAMDFFQGEHLRMLMLAAGSNGFADLYRAAMRLRGFDPQIVPLAYLRATGATSSLVVQHRI
jgi:hypothetical protein